MNKRYQVFVSSTYRDLQVERTEVMKALLELNCIPCGMEYFPAASETQWDFIRRLIEGCDYYIVIVGGCYGSLAPDGTSYTQKEYEYAISQRVPTLAFTHENAKQLPRKYRETSPAKQKKLSKFVQLVERKLCKRWKNAHDLAGVVTRSLNQVILDQPRTGWVRAMPDGDRIKHSKLAQKFANTYWVAHDLLLTVVMLLHRSPRERILEGLFQAKHHLSEIGYVRPSFRKQLVQLYQDAKVTKESDWTEQRRLQVAKQIEFIARELGNVIAAAQPAFRSHPKPRSVRKVVSDH